MRVVPLIAAALLSAIAIPAAAQDSMMAGGRMKSAPAMKMSATDKRKVASCNAMSHDKMMKDAGCIKMMKMHPDMMKGGDAMMDPGH